MALTRILGFEQRFSSKRGTVEDWVLLAPADDVVKTQTWRRIESIRPPENGIEQSRDPAGTKYAAMRMLWNEIEPAYEAWKRGVELPETGTPLAAWGSMTRETVEALQRAGLRTVEEVAEAGDSMIGKVKVPNARELPILAAKFLEARGASDAAEKLAAQEAEIAELKAMVAELAQAQQTKRGRPKKEDAEAA